MTRIAMIAAAVAATFASSAFAADVAPAAQKSFTQEQAQQHLVRLGYTGVSELAKDSDGRWAGFGYKDGKRVPVAIEAPQAPAAQ